MPQHTHGVKTYADVAGVVSGRLIRGTEQGSVPAYISENIDVTGGNGSHSHGISTTSTNSGAASGSTANSTAFNTGNWGTASPSGHTHTMSNTGSAGSSSQSIMPPYLVVYIWKRTA